MAQRNDGIYTVNEFRQKGVLKLAPDFYVVINGADDARVLVSNSTKSTAEYQSSDGTTHTKQESNNDAGFQKFNFRSGVTAMTTSCATQPGAGSCSLTYVCPQYSSLNQSFYVDQPNGVKVPFFASMMEVRVYAKGRFMRQEGGDMVPSYYPVFWGFITSVNEAYNNNETTFSLTCRDMLGWWEYQNINVVASPPNQFYGGASTPSTGSAYRYMNPWEIILNLFQETTFANFVYPSFLANGLPPYLGMPDSTRSTSNSDKGLWELLSGGVMDSWIGRYGIGNPVNSSSRQKTAFSNLELFGVSKIFNLKDLANSPFTADGNSNSLPFSESPAIADSTGASNRTNAASVSAQDREASATPSSDPGGDRVYRAKAYQTLYQKVDVNFSVFGRVLPFGAFDSFSLGTEPVKMTKLEVAALAADSIHFEFFQDVNGMFVFKPPFYNMDTSNNPVYVIKAGDILSVDFAEDSSQIVTVVEASGPVLMQTTSVDYSATHADFGLMKQYGIRQRTVKVAYGNSPDELRAMAASEMAKANAKAYTGSITIPFRPELRLGYPIYIDHVDSYYYVTSLQHSITMGSTTTTTLTLEAKRSRLYNYKGELLQGYIQRSFATADNQDRSKESSRADQLDTFKKNLNSADARGVVNAQGALGSAAQKAEADSSSQNSTESSYLQQSMTPSEKYYKAGGFISSPEPGFYRLVQSDFFKSFSNPSSDTAKNVSNENPLDAESLRKEVANGALTELTHFTGDTLPYTDVNGFYHIGGFPYGANMVLKGDGALQDYQNFYGNSMAFKASSLDQQGKAQDVKQMGVDPISNLSEGGDVDNVLVREGVSSDALGAPLYNSTTEKEKIGAIANTQDPTAANRKAVEDTSHSQASVQTLHSGAF